MHASSSIKLKLIRRCLSIVGMVTGSDSTTSRDLELQEGTKEFALENDEESDTKVDKTELEGSEAEETDEEGEVDGGGALDDSPVSLWETNCLIFKLPRSLLLRLFVLGIFPARSGMLTEDGEVEVQEDEEASHSNKFPAGGDVEGEVP